MGISLRDTKRTSAPSDGRERQAPGGRRRPAMIIIGVSALVALLAVGGVLVFSRQAQTNSTPTATTQAGMQAAGPISAVAGGHLMLSTTSGWKDVTPARFGADPMDGTFLTPALGWALDVQVSGKTTKDFVIYSTSDGGATWKSVTVPWQDEGQATAAYVQFVDAEHGFVSVALHPQTSRRPGFLYTTSDGGKSWTKHELPFGGPVAFSSASTGIVVGGGIDSSHNLISITRDGGATWHDEPIIAPAGLELVDRYISTPAFEGQQGILAVNYGTQAVFYSSDDGGVTWLQSNATFPVTFADREVDPVVSLFGSRGWAMVGSVFYTTSDGGKTWAVANASRNLANVQALGVTGASTGWAVVGNGVLLTTSDGGKTWTAAQ